MNVEECRICNMSYVPVEEVGPLLKNVCECKGTSANVHERCFIDWIRFRCKKKYLFSDQAKYIGVSRCEVCNGRYDLEIFCNAYVSQVTKERKKNMFVSADEYTYKEIIELALMSLSLLISIAVILYGPGPFIEFVPRSIIILCVFACRNSDPKVTYSTTKLFIVMYTFCSPIAQFYLNMYRSNVYERFVTWFVAVPILETCFIETLELFF